MFGKSRLAPVKSVSIPRLELMAAVMATNIDEMLKRELKVNTAASYFWSDSMAVLGYIRNRDKKFDVFVANRLSKIHETTTVGQWKHVPTDQNPADDASRGIKSKALQGRWLNGPEFLSRDESDWPSSREDTVTNRYGSTNEASSDRHANQQYATDQANIHITKTRLENFCDIEESRTLQANMYEMKARQESCQGSQDTKTQANVNKIESSQKHCKEDG